MELGARLRQARLEAGLSQRQLCGDEITRNMLSQIENGSAKPSMATLRYLSSRLGKPMGYFLEEQAVTSPNQQVMADARNAGAEMALQKLKDYQAPDPVFDRERWLLEALACMELAEQVLQEGKDAYAWSLLEQAAQAGSKTPYYTRESERKRLLLCYKVYPHKARQLAAMLPENDLEPLLLAQAALEGEEPERAGRILDDSPGESCRWHYLRGEAYLAQGHYGEAADCYLAAEAELPGEVYPKLEQCYRELEDYKQAYLYACKQRNHTP